MIIGAKSYKWREIYGCRISSSGISHDPGISQEQLSQSLLNFNHWRGKYQVIKIATLWKSLKLRGLHKLHLKAKIWELPDIQWQGCLVQSNYRPLVLCGRWMWKQQEYAGIALLATDLLPEKLHAKLIQCPDFSICREFDAEASLWSRKARHLTRPLGFL